MLLRCWRAGRLSEFPRKRLAVRGRAVVPVVRQDEEVSDLPEVAEPKRCGNGHCDGKADERTLVFRYESFEAAAADVPFQPTRRPCRVGSFAIVDAIPVDRPGT